MGRIITTTFLPFGRMPRWQYILITILISLPIVGFMLDALRRGTGLNPSVLSDPLAIQLSNTVLVILGVQFYLGWSSTINRLHDMGYSGFALLWLIPLPVASVAATFWLRDAAVQRALGLDASTAIFVGGSLAVVAYALTLIFALYIGLKCLFTPGDRGENRYGPAPRDA